MNQAEEASEPRHLPPSLWREPEPQPAHWPALQLHDVFKIYRSGPVETVALRGLELEVQPAELVAVLGPSGCGKSTMLALAAALDEPSAGEVRVAGRSLQRLREVELDAFRARELSLVFQSDNLWPALSAMENVELSLRLAGHAHPTEAAVEALRLFGLGKRVENRAGELSGGEQQRVAIALAFARQASLVLADEPTGELDTANASVVLEALSELRARRGSTVVLVTHSAQVAEGADRVIEMRDGRVVA
ncbi:MAG: ABC transporter ATP-binding protein [Solirubrobacteraceae bacterium]